MEFYRGPIEQTVGQGPENGARLVMEQKTQGISALAGRDSAIPLSVTDRQAAVATPPRVAEVQALSAANELRDFYRRLGVDEDSIMQLYAEQTHGRNDLPLTRRNTRFLTEAVQAVSHVPVEPIESVRAERAPTRAQMYEIFVANEAARKAVKTDAT